jgi:hypothetical protein
VTRPLTDAEIDAFLVAVAKINIAIDRLLAALGVST